MPLSTLSPWNAFRQRDLQATSDPVRQIVRPEGNIGVADPPVQFGIAERAGLTETELAVD
jgi:hypothetical protein